MSNLVSANGFFANVLEISDIGGTNATSDYVDLRAYHHAAFCVHVDSTLWHVTDDLDTCKLVQATDSGGSDVKDITGKAISDGTDPEGLDYILEVDSAELDIANGFTHVAVYVAEAGNTDVANVYADVYATPARFANANEAGSAEVVY